MSLFNICPREVNRNMAKAPYSELFITLIYKNIAIKNGNTVNVL